MATFSQCNSQGDELTVNGSVLVRPCPLASNSKTGAEGTAVDVGDKGVGVPVGGTEVGDVECVAGTRVGVGVRVGGGNAGAGAAAGAAGLATIPGSGVHVGRDGGAIWLELAGCAFVLAVWLSVSSRASSTIPPITATAAIIPMSQFLPA